MTPEVIRVDKVDVALFSTKSDVDSFGVVVHELLYGKLLYGWNSVCSCCICVPIAPQIQRTFFNLKLWSEIVAQLLIL